MGGSTMMRYAPLCVATILLLVVAVSGDDAALPTLSEQIASIESKKHANNFFEGEGLLESAEGDAAKVAGCILDKGEAVVHESSGDAPLPLAGLNDLKIDLAACCTNAAHKSWCTTSLGEAYTNLVTASKTKDKKESATAMATAFTQITAAARHLVTEHKLKATEKGQKGLDACAKEACTAEKMADVVKTFGASEQGEDNESDGDNEEEGEEGEDKDDKDGKDEM